MHAEILATGDELRTGTLVDSNSAFIAEQLEHAGVVVSRHHCVGDDMDVLTAVMTEISMRADIAVVTGGLGPTTDDLSSQAAARVAGVDLALDQRALDDIQSYLESRGLKVSTANRKQALLPSGAVAMYNPVGTAPGFELKMGRCVFFFLPGVPYEMRRMTGDQVLPRINGLLGGQRMFCQTRTLTTFGLPESAVGEKVAGLTRHYPTLKLGLRAKFPEIQVKLYAYAHREADVGRDLDAAQQWVGDQLGRYLVSDRGHSVARTVGDLLKARGATLAVAESCTGGQIAHMLTNAAGASAFFLLSAVTYANAAKTRLLDVSPKTLSDDGAVSERTARQMARGARQLAGATFGLATTGIAGPDGGSPEKPVGTVCLGLATADEVISRRLVFSFGRRLMNKKIFATAALDLMRRYLQGAISR